MCVIIERNPNVGIDTQKIESACLVNPDGYGLIVIDRDKLEVVKEYPKGGNDPEVILRRLEDAKDQKVLLHLRFNTAGATDDANCHPFTVLSKEHDGYEMQLMHNGTIYDFKDSKSKMSDTYHFTTDFLRPLYQRSFAGGLTHDKLMDVPLCNKIIDQFIGSGNIVTLVDELGQIKIFNRNKGFQHEGWWSSNTYSFNRSHRSNSYDSKSYSYSTGKVWDSREQKYVNKTSSVVTPASNATTGEGLSEVNFLKQKDGATTNNTNSDSKTTQTGSQNTGGKDTSNVTSFRGYTKEVPVERMSIRDILGYEDVTELFELNQSNVETIVQEDPELATLMIMDLIREIYFFYNDEVAEDEDVDPNDFDEDDEDEVTCKVIH